MNLSLAIATLDDAKPIAALRNEAAQRLTSFYGKGHWSYQATDKGVINGMKGNSKVLIAKDESLIVGSLRLTTKKPWAIDIAYFTKVPLPLYLVDMVVHPAWQRKGIGKYMLQQTRSFVIAWPAHAIRLDAYDNAAGAGEFYSKCGFTEKGHVVYRNNPLVYFELLV